MCRRLFLFRGSFMQQQWHIRLGDQVIGPVSSSELRRLASAGGISRDNLVSLDSIVWRRADSLQELEFPPKRARRRIQDKGKDLRETVTGGPPPAHSDPTANSWTAIWLIVIGLISLAVLLFICCGIAGFLISSPGTSPSIAPVALVPDDTRERTTRATYDYWGYFGSLLQTPLPNGSTQAKTNAIVEIASRIEQLPVVDVDPIAIQCAFDVSKTLRYCAEVVGRNNDPAVFVEAIARGVSGDPFGKGLEMIHDGRQVQTLLQTMQANIAQTRAELSQRYGIEFHAW